MKCCEVFEDSWEQKAQFSLVYILKYLLFSLKSIVKCSTQDFSIYFRKNSNMESCQYHLEGQRQVTWTLQDESQNPASSAGQTCPTGPPSGLLSRASGHVDLDRNSTG